MLQFGVEVHLTKQEIQQPVLLSIEDVTIRDLVIDGNNHSNIRGITTRPEGNTLVYADDIRNVNFSSLDIRNSIGDGITAQSNKNVNSKL